MSDCGCGPHGQGVVPGPIKKLACAKPIEQPKLETVIYQAQVGDDTGAYAPKFGAHHNAVVKYLANDAVYLYDKDGQYTLFSKHGQVVEGDDGYINGDQLFQIKTALEEMDEQLQQEIADETVAREKAVAEEAEARETKDQELEEAIEAEETARIEAVEQLTNDLDEETKAREDGDNELQSQLDALAASTDVIDVVDTYADLQSYNTAEVHLNDIIKVLNDETHEGAITYYRWDGSKWNYVGSTGPYYTKAEADDRFGLKEDVENALGEIAELGADKQDKLVGEGEGQNIKTINGESLLGEGNIEVQGGGGTLYSEYGTNEDGALTQKFVSDKLNSSGLALGLNANNTRASENVAIGYEAKTLGSYSNGSIAIGRNAQATGNANSSLTTVAGSIAIGANSVAQVQNNLSIGISANTRGGGDCIAIGNYSQAGKQSGTVYASDGDDIAIGRSAYALQGYSVAIGNYSKTTRRSEVSFGDGSTGNSYSTRYLANVRAGTQDTDAVNLAQLNAAVGDINTLLETLTTGEGAK